jgi:DNA-binding transcriptional ArsR family regulator
MTDNHDDFGLLDKLIHEPARLSIMAVLSACEEADFQYLLNETGLTKGNLSSHLAKLEQGGYLTIKKEFKGKIPHTVIMLTPFGENQFNLYVKRLRRIMKKLK